MNRRGNWIQTHLGNRYFPLDPRPEEVHIEDIAHALSMKCRFGGHCSRFYSVAEHSVIVSRHVSQTYALWGLLHDAAEAYLADIPRPVKCDIPGWKQIERRVQEVICWRFGLGFIEPPEVKTVDSALLSRERDVLMVHGNHDWFGLVEPLEVEIYCWTPEEAKAEFLKRFDEVLGY